MPQEPIQSFTFSGKTYNIPQSKVKDFLNDVPDAKPVKPDLSITRILNMGYEPNSQKRSLMPASLDESIDQDQNDFAHRLASLPVHGNMDNVPINSEYYKAAVKKLKPEPQHGLSKAIENAGTIIQNLPQSIAAGTVKLGEGLANQFVNMAGNSRFTPGAGVYSVRPYTQPGERQEQAASTQEVQNKIGQAAESTINTVAPGYNETQRKIDEMGPVAKFVGHTTGGLAEFLPAMALAAPTGGASLYFSAYQDGLDQMKDKDVDPETKQLYAMGLGIVNMALMKLPISHALDKTILNKISNKVVLDAVVKAQSEAGGKLTQDGFLNALGDAAENSINKLKTGGLKALKGVGEGAIFTGAQQGANTALQQGVNAVEGKKIFELPKLSDLASSVLAGSISIGMLSHLNTAFSGETKNYLQDRIINAKSPEDLADIHAQVFGMLNAKKITPEQAQNLNDNIDKYAGIVSTLPASLTPEQAKTASDLIDQRDQVKQQADGMQKQIDALNDLKQQVSNNADEALKNLSTEEIDRRIQSLDNQQGQARLFIESANDQIREAATGKPYEYFQKDGQYYKQQGDNPPEETSKDLYDLKKINDDAKRGIFNAQVETPQPVSGESRTGPLQMTAPDKIPMPEGYDNEGKGSLVENGTEVTPTKIPGSGEFGARAMFSRGLSRMAAYEKSLGTEQDALKSAYRAASAEGAARSLLNKAGIEIKKAFRKEGTDYANKVYTQMRKVLVQSRLNGLRQRWNDWSDITRDMPAPDVQKWVEDPAYRQDHSLPDIQSITHALGNSKPFRGIERSANVFMSDGDYTSLRDLLSTSFQRAGNMVQDLPESTWNGKSYDEVRSHPDIQKAKSIYQSTIGEPVAKMQEAAGGTLTDYLGEENAYYPLLPIKEESGKPNNILRFLSLKKSPLKNESNEFANLATGLSKEYDTNLESITNRVIRAYQIDSRNELIRTLQESGYMVRYQPGYRDDIINIDNRYYEATKINTNEDQQGAPSFYLVPKGIARDIEGLITKREKSKNSIYQLTKKMTGAVNRFALASTGEAVAHTWNLVTRLHQFTPFAFRDPNSKIMDITGKTVGALPFMKHVMQTGHLLFMNPTSERWMNVLDEMREAGEIPKKYGSVTFSKSFSEMTGAKRVQWWKLNFSPLLYSVKGADIRSRLMIFDISKSINPNATPLEMRKVMSSIGDYNPGLQSDIVKFTKQSLGIAPFIVSQQARLSGGLKSVIDLPGVIAGIRDSDMPINNLPKAKKYLYFISNQVNASVYGLIASWVAMYATHTGKNPLTTPGARLGVIPLTDKDKDWLQNTPTGRLMLPMFHQKGKWKDINIGAYYSPASTGVKMLGSDAYYSAKMLGATDGEAFEKGFTQMLNTNTSAVFAGSPVMHAVTGMFGVAPYIVDMRDEGQPAMKLLPITAAAPSGEQLGFNLAHTALHLNPVVAGAVGAATGNKLEQPWLRTDWNTAFYQFVLSQYLPNILVTDKNVGTQEYYLKKDRRKSDMAHENGQKK